MTREEGLRLANDFSRLTLPSERSIDYLEIGSGNVKMEHFKEDVLTDYNGFAALQQDFSLDLLEVIENWSDDKETNLRIKRFFAPPGIFDGLVTVLSLEMRKNPMRPHLCERESRKAVMRQLIDIITTAVNDRQPRDFSEICEVLPMITLPLKRSNLQKLGEMQKRDVLNYKLYLQGYHKFCYHHWRPADVRRVGLDNFKGNNTGCLFWGERGIGKSQLLTYMTAWAHEENWINVSITNHEEFVDGTWDIFRFSNGLYL